jgi:hypothetical protein
MVAFKKRKTTTGGVVSNNNSGGSGGSGSGSSGSFGPVSDPATGVVVKNESKEAPEPADDPTPALKVERVVENAVHAAEAVPQATTVGITAAPEKVSMKLNPVGGGAAKRKFRVREPSP